MKGQRVAFWRYLSKRHGRLWFLRQPSRWWSPSLRLAFAFSGAMDAMVAMIAAATKTPQNFLKDKEIR